jgi:hypothetical protein
MPVSSNEILAVLVLITAGHSLALTALNRIWVKTSALMGGVDGASL